MSIAALIVAAGRGVRAGGGLPKQYAALGGEPMLARALRPFLAHPLIAAVQTVIGADDGPLYAAATAGSGAKLAPPVTGGASRQDSARLGLEALAARAPRLVLIHDAARPFVSQDLIGRVIEALERHPGAVPASPVADTLKRANPDGFIVATIERENLWRAETPQGFRFAAILDAHRRAAAEGLHAFTDDAALAERAGLTVALVAGSPRNVKITTAEDLAMANHLLAPSSAWETRTATGFDVHRFCPGDHVWLCGVSIPHSHGLLGHSDADAGLHALTDALLGAIGEGDIGDHFPPSDPRWKGAPSSLFLADAARRIAARGGRIVNVDVTLLCEAPKIAPHRAAMRAAMAEILAIEPSRVSVKATTTEGLGATGRREGLAALASATVLLPS